MSRPACPATMHMCARPQGDCGIYGCAAQRCRLEDALATASADLERAVVLLRRVEKYVTEDRAVTPGYTRLARVAEEARAFLRDIDTRSGT